MSPRHALLSQDEHIVRRMRTHFKAILGNTLAELVLIIVGVFASVYLPTEWAPYSHEIVWAIVIVATFPIFIMPFI